jgi:rhodanese-related sulfurtransferase/DNA-binding transcriptional ArsR family regulator
LRSSKEDAGVADRQAKDALYDALAEVAKALASGRRAEIVELLAQSDRSVEEIASEIGQTVANTSHHLRAMARAGLVRTRREGTRIFYGLASERVAELWAAMRDVAAVHVAGVTTLAGSYLGERHGIDFIDRDELVARLPSGRLVLLDVRPTVEYAAGHIPGARSVPLDQLEDALQRLPKRSDVVAYCRGPFCVYADDAVRELLRRGYRARRLVDGFPEWRRAGLPVETGERSDIVTTTGMSRSKRASA